ncbi:Nucleotide-binding, alpha-beta plait [Cordyceps fumosorosea ARSEF 2679]|uniref:Nucleotide-binding, alpha-beta plait n=1 Tax=Cordyceps fumosorosea (strain ARSEF 2679) TaxID=1081104 RepID=A0A162LPC1_CORFA|nr:Nucleotide-binding, alpha-beta plait [Cordyceps fumosorosea ARSEF 2679]OAA73684.1 Nucleotide-binding, alpha-beta plait [Cordyceps fumosorosea ARSEF 2679]
MTTIASRGLRPNASLPAKVQSIPPNQTIYITNLPSAKIQKEDLRTALYMLFSTFGPVLDVVALKTMSMRGQAHVVFRDVQAATQAMRTLDGEEFLGRPLKIQYAKSKSHFISKIDGTLMPPSKGAAAAEQTELQQSIFNAPPAGTAAATTTATATQAKPPSAVDHAMKDVSGSPESRGQKRNRDDESEPEDSGEDMAMDEDSDDE